MLISSRQGMVATMKTNNIEKLVQGEMWTGDTHYHTLNPPTHKHVKRVDTLRDTVMLDRGFIARPVYQTRTNCSLCTSIRFLGYQLVESSSGLLWKMPRKLDAIKAHHAQVVEAIRACEKIIAMFRDLDLAQTWIAEHPEIEAANRMAAA
jgi:hypothetical protein